MSIVMVSTVNHVGKDGTDHDGKGANRINHEVKMSRS